MSDEGKLDVQVGGTAMASHASSAHTQNRDICNARWVHAQKLRNGICRSRGSFLRPTHTLALQWASQLGCEGEGVNPVVIWGGKQQICRADDEGMRAGARMGKRGVGGKHRVVG